MTEAFLSLAFVACLPFTAAFGQDQGAPTAPSETEVSSAAAPVALLWVPREENLDWDSIVRLGLDLPSLGLTIAVSPRALADAPPETLAELPANIELAMRPAGDPVLPLIKELQNPAVGAAAADLPAFSRPQDVIAHLSNVKKGYSGDRLPGGGITVGGGALTRELLSLFYPMGFSWVAAGDPENSVSSGPWLDAHGVAFLSFKPLNRDLSNWPGPSSEPAAYVLDDTADLSQSPGTIHTLRELTVFPGSETTPFTGVSAYLKDPRVIARLQSSLGEIEKGTLSFRPWTGDYGPWVGQPLKRAAWKLLASVARTLESQQNTGTLAPKVLDAAGTQLLDAEGGRYFLNLDTRFPAAVREAAEREFRVSLSNVFRILSLPAPEDLQRPLLAGETASGQEGPDAEAGSVESGDDWLVFRDPSRENSTPSPLPVSLDAETDSGLWDLRRFAVGWDTATVTFSVTLSTLSATVATPKGFTHLMFDIYIDMNHRTGAGSTGLLPGRDAMAEARDAWEFAVTVTGWGGKLYRVGPEGQIVFLEPVGVRISTAANTVFVDVSAATLRGNPKKWGYIVPVMALDLNTATQDLWLPMNDAKGSPLLDVLAPWQREPLTISQRHRLEAVRLK